MFFFSIVFFLVSSNHETFVTETRSFWGGGYRTITLLRISCQPLPLAERWGVPFWPGLGLVLTAGARWLKNVTLLIPVGG